MDSLQVAVEGSDGTGEDSMTMRKGFRASRRSCARISFCLALSAMTAAVIGIGLLHVMLMADANRATQAAIATLSEKLDGLTASTSTVPFDGEQKDFHVECLFATGGGTVRRTGGLPQADLHDDDHCKRTFDWYFEPATGRYWHDLARVRDEALRYYITELAFRKNDPTQLVIFDIDETTLSNLNTMRAQTYGLPAHKDPQQVDTSDQQAQEDVTDSGAPAIEAMRTVYKACYDYGMSVAFITGRSERGRKATEKNLKHEGYGSKCDVDDDGKALRSKEPCYLELHMRSVKDDSDKLASVYKPERRQQFVDNGYHIVGSFGDQFSDLEGLTAAVASWKLPNPLYYIL